MIDRRAFLRTTAIGVAGLGSAALLASCSTVTRSTDIKAINRKVELPTYIRYRGPKPDLPAVDGVPDAFRRYPSDAVKALTGRPGDGSVLQGFVPTSSPIPPAKDRNEYWQELDDRLGLDLRMTISPAGDFPNKFQTALAGDSLGDAFNIFGTPPYLPQLLEAQAADLSPYLSGDRAKDYPFLANLPTQSWRGCVFSGGIYALPISRGIIGTSVLWSRADLFDKRGVDSAFSSVDELISIATGMTAAKSNRWGLAGVPGRTLGAMLGLPNAWQEKGGRLTKEEELEGHLDLLATGRRMIQKGIVHPDSVSAFNGKVWFNQGSAALIEDTYTAAPGFYLQNVDGPSFRLGLPTIPGPGGSSAKLWLQNPNNSITAIKKGSPDRIRTVLEVLNWMAAPFGTEEYTFRKYGVEGRDFAFQNGQPALTKVGNSETALGAFPIQYLVDSPIPIYYAGHPEGTDTVYDNIKIVQPDAILDPVFGLYSPTNATKGSLLGTLITNGTNDIYLGRKPVSSWKDTMAQWRARGGDAVRAEYERALEAREG